jgi:hypothetical protein
MAAVFVAEKPRVIRYASFDSEGGGSREGRRRLRRGSIGVRRRGSGRNSSGYFRDAKRLHQQYTFENSLLLINDLLAPQWEMANNVPVLYSGNRPA